MDDADKKILENKLAVPLGKAVSQWMSRNDVADSVIVNATVSHPSCYVDEQGIPHFGPLITVNVQILDDDSEDEED